MAQLRYGRAAPKELLKMNDRMAIGIAEKRAKEHCKVKIAENEQKNGL